MKVNEKNENWEDFFRVKYNGEPVMPGKVLVAEPFLQDKYFGRSVVYLANHDSAGSVGFVLNKRLDVNVGAVIAELEGIDFPVYCGGPVGERYLYYLHCRKEIPDSEVVGNGIFYGGDFQTVVKMLREGDLNERDIRFFAGYSGWGRGQLENELESDSWLVGSLSREEIFDMDGRNLWRDTMRGFGNEQAVWANYPVNPGMN